MQLIVAATLVLTIVATIGEAAPLGKAAVKSRTF